MQMGEKMTKGAKGFVKGAAILGGAGLIVKIIGAIFRIPLTNIIGAEAAWPIIRWLILCMPRCW